MCVCIIYKIIKTEHPIANACVCMHTFLIYHFKAKVKKNFLFYTLIVREILYTLSISEPCIKKLSFITIVRMFRLLFS